MVQLISSRVTTWARRCSFGRSRKRRYFRVAQILASAMKPSSAISISIKLLIGGMSKKISKQRWDTIAYSICCRATHMAQPWDTALLATDGSNQIPPWYKMWKNRFVSAKVQASTLKRSWCREASAVLAAMDVAYTWVCSTCHTSGVHIAYSWKGYKSIFIDATITHLSIPTAP